MNHEKIWGDTEKKCGKFEAMIGNCLDALGSGTVNKQHDLLFVLGDVLYSEFRNTLNSNPDMQLIEKIDDCNEVKNNEKSKNPKHKKKGTVFAKKTISKADEIRINNAPLSIFFVTVFINSI